MKKIVFCILSLISINSFAYETSISCDDMNDLMADIEEVSTLVFKSACEKSSESSFLGLITSSKYEHSISIDFEASGIDGAREELVPFTDYIKVGAAGSKFIQLQNALNEHNSSELESYFPLLNPYSSPYARFVGEFQIRKKER